MSITDPYFTTIITAFLTLFGGCVGYLKKRSLSMFMRLRLIPDAVRPSHEA